MGGMPARILVVDDEPSIVDAVSTALRYEGFLVAEATDGIAAMNAILRDPPDLVVLDVMLPDIDGFDVCRRMRADGIDSLVLFLSAKDQLVDKVTGLGLGADDYVTKPFSLAEIIARVHAMLRRREAPDAHHDQYEFADVRLDQSRHQVWRAGTEIRLTATEFRLLHFLMANPRLVLSKQQILDHVWSEEYDGDATIVETYVGYLRRKLDAHGPALIETVRLVGYVLRDPAEAST